MDEIGSQSHAPSNAKDVNNAHRANNSDVAHSTATSLQSNRSMDLEHRDCSDRLQVPGASRFTESFPNDKDLQELVEAFENGHYHLVRKLGSQLILGSSDPNVKRAAEEIINRLKPDPLMAKLLWITGLLLVLLTAWAYLL